MAVTNTYTCREICTRALRLAGLTDKEEAPSSEEINEAITVLDMMLKSLQGFGYHLWTKASQSLTLTTAASYSLSPDRPLEILNANLKRDGIETPMTRMTRNEYDRLPDKDSTGLPTTFYYDRQRESALFYVWPVLSTAAGETVEITYSREIEDATLNAAIDVPGEWWEVIVYQLADRLMDANGVTTRPNITARAQLLLEEALGFDRQESVYFRPAE